MASRMAAAERRELMLDAATKMFALGGYAGTSTDAVAREAEVSQPYVVRMFGTKLELFIAVFERACRSIEDAFAQVIADSEFDAMSEAGQDQLGETYVELLRDSDLLHVLMHGFAAATVPEIGQVARAGMERIFETLRGTGWDDEQVRDFIAQGMLLNVLLSMNAFEEHSGGLADLVSVCLPESVV